MITEKSALYLMAQEMKDQRYKQPTLLGELDRLTGIAVETKMITNCATMQTQRAQNVITA